MQDMRDCVIKCANVTIFQGGYKAPATGTVVVASRPDEREGGVSKVSKADLVNES